MTTEQLRLGNYYNSLIEEYTKELDILRQMRKNEEKGQNIEMRIFQKPQYSQTETIINMRYNLLYWDKDFMLDKYEEYLQKEIDKAKSNLEKL
jgi:hypothetical protein